MVMSLLTTFLKLRSPLGLLVRYKQNPCKSSGGSGPKKDIPNDSCKKKAAKKYDCIPNTATKKRKCGDSKKVKQAGPCQSKPKHSDICKPIGGATIKHSDICKPIGGATIKHSDICKPIGGATIKQSGLCRAKKFTKNSKCSSEDSGKSKYKSRRQIQTNICSPKKSKINVSSCIPKTAKSACQGDHPAIAKALTMKTLNPGIIKLQYAVRGPLVIRANAIAKEMRKGTKKPFPAVIRANIGDAQAMGQMPLTYFRQVLAGALYPELLNRNFFPEDVVQRVCKVIEACSGRSVGAYTDSQGIEPVRREVAQYICKRDGFECDYNNVFLCAGASTGIKNILKLLINKINGKDTGVLIPIPQYPLYSAALAEYGLGQCPYYLNEKKNWSLDVSELKRAFKEHSKKFAVRALVVINPGNPTGQLLTEENICELIMFAAERNLIILADEVYQHNIWCKDCKFHSFKKVLMENKTIAQQVELASFMTISKGYFGECGLRGGWCELTNLDPNVRAQLYKARPPEEGEPSYDQFTTERAAILSSLEARAEMVVKTFNSMEGFKCNPVQAALYAFPNMKLPPKAIEAAKAAKKPPDVFYAFQLLEETGVCVVPGSGFGQEPGTYHFRTTILPQMEPLKHMLNLFKEFHANFIKKYS